MNVIQTVAGLKARAGGVARSVPALCEALAREGCRVVLVSQSPHDSDNSLRLPSPQLVESRLVRGYDWEKWRVSFTPRLSRHLRSICNEVRPAIVHDHGVWLEMNHVCARTASRLQIARVVSPRGMLDAWSLKYRGSKKRLAWSMYQSRDLQSATAFCATSTMEAAAIRSLGFRQPIAVIPNGIDIPSIEPRAHARQKRVLFLSRLHPKKGLLDLIRAWANVAADGWQLVVAGPDEDGYRAVLNTAIAHEGVGSSVAVIGNVSDCDRHSVMQSADVFVLPSYSENFGMVVGEALAAAVPVITTTATPWQQLQSAQCGWWISPGVESLQHALSEAISLTDGARSAMGARGRALVEREFSWRHAAEKHIALYRWIAGDEAAPAFLFA